MYIYINIILFLQTSIVEQKQIIKELENKKDARLRRSNELRKDRIPLIQKFDEIINKIAKHKDKYVATKEKVNMNLVFKI